MNTQTLFSVGTLSGDTKGPGIRQEKVGTPGNPL